MSNKGKKVDLTRGYRLSVGAIPYRRALQCSCEVGVPTMSDTLVYRTHPNGGLVVVPREVARRTDNIHRALTNAKTWGEFRIMLPPGEWEIVVHMLRDIADFYDDDGVAIWEFNHHAFNGYEDIPAASDGDYPAWLQERLQDYIPSDLLERYGKRTSSAVGEYFWYIDECDVLNLLAALRQRGYSVSPEDNLWFF